MNFFIHIFEIFSKSCVFRIENRWVSLSHFCCPEPTLKDESAALAHRHGSASPASAAKNSYLISYYLQKDSDEH